MTTFILVLNLFLKKTNTYFHRKLSFSEVSERIQHFQGEGGGPTISRGGGTNCLSPIETNITCDFPGGGGSGPLSPSGSAHGKIKNL